MTFRIGDEGLYWVISNDEWISLATINSGTPNFPQSNFSYWKSVPKPNERRGGPFSGINHSWDLHLRHQLGIPYRPVVIMLTILTTWLLLSKPRMKNVDGPTVSAHHE